MDMACNQIAYPRDGHGPHEGTTVKPLTATLKPSAFLIVSNSPERIGQEFAFPVNLYHCSINLSEVGVKTIRVFLWHENKTDGNVVFRTMVREANGLQAKILRHRLHTDSSGALSNIGICVAKTHLYGSFSDIKEADIILGQQWKAVTEGSAAPGHLRGLILEMDVEITAPGDFEYKTVVSQDHQNPDHDNVVSGVQPTQDGSGTVQHVRGWWPACEAGVECGEFDANVTCDVAGVPATICSINLGEGKGVEFEAFKHQGLTLDKNGNKKGNAGAYGANFTYSVSLRNDGDAPVEVLAALVCRNNGEFGKFFGAAKILSPEGYPDGGVEKIFSGESLRRCRLTEVKMASGWKRRPIVVPANSSVEVRLRYTMAGAAGSPVTLQFWKVC